MKRKTLDASREVRLWLATALGVAAMFPEVRQFAMDKARWVKEQHYPSKIKEKVKATCSRKEEEEKKVTYSPKIIVDGWTQD